MIWWIQRRNKRDELSPEEVSELELSYFELQAYWGATKHMGGLKATKGLIELCHIDEGKYVLDVGCGIGITPCYVAKKYGCKVVGVDIRDSMIERSKERAKRERVEDKVEFRVADAQNLPFEDGLFDAVISEAVLAFVQDRQRALSEYTRVTKPGGCVGLNESTWLKTPLPTEVTERVSRAFVGARLETADTWKELLAGSGLKDIVVRTYTLTALSDTIDRIKWFGFRGLVLNAYRMLSFYMSSSANRRAMKRLVDTTRNVPKNFFEYYGYGIYGGRK